MTQVTLTPVAQPTLTLSAPVLRVGSTAGAVRMVQESFVFPAPHEPTQPVEPGTLMVFCNGLLQPDGQVDEPSEGDLISLVYWTPA